MSAVAKLPLHTPSADLREQLTNLDEEIESARADLASGKLEHTELVAMRGKRDELVDRIAGEEILERRDNERRDAEERTQLGVELARLGEEHGLIAYRREADAFAERAVPLEASLAALLTDILTRVQAGTEARARAEKIASELGVESPSIPHWTTPSLIRHIQSMVWAAQHAAGRDIQEASDLPELVRPWRG